MEDKKLREDVEAMVMSIFSEKEEADMRKKTEEALQQSARTIEDLTTALEDRNAEVEELKSTVSEGESNIEDLNTQLEAAKEEIKTSNDKLTETETALEEIKKDRLTDVRLSELEEARVAHSDEKSRAGQAAKIREMSDEGFQSYKEELVSIREAVISEIEANAPEANTEEEVKPTSEEETPAEEETASDEETSEEETTDEEETLPANIDPAQAVSAALNLDIFPSEGMVAKYKELGQAMANSFKK